MNKQDSPMASPEHGLAPLKKKRPFLQLLLLVACLCIAGLAALGYDAYSFLTTPGSRLPQELVLSIEDGATFDRVAWDLKKAGAITDVERFRLLARYKKRLGKIQAGEFAINTGWTPEQVLTQLTTGKAILHKLFVREGLAWWDVAKLIEEQGFASAKDFEEVITDPAFLAEHNIPLGSVEGFLFPETYMLRKPKHPNKKHAKKIADLMVQTFWKKTAPIWQQLPHKEHNAPPAEPQGTMQRAMTAAANATVGMMADAMEKAVSHTAELHQPAEETPTAPNAQASKPAAAPTNTAALPDEDVAANAQMTPQLLQGETPETALQHKKATRRVQAAPAKTTKAQRTATLPPKKPVHPSQVDPKALEHMLIMASLVEKETAVAAERSIVSGVYANRLRIGMLLQCDPTIPYGIGKTFSGRIRRSQLQNATNPYNTYQHRGLPPGPICSPGTAAMKAAMAPAEHNYLYFVSTGTDGTHRFSTNLTDHSAAVREYRKTQGR